MQQIIHSAKLFSSCRNNYLPQMALMWWFV